MQTAKSFALLQTTAFDYPLRDDTRAEQRGTQGRFLALNMLLVGPGPRKPRSDLENFGY
jgi:hypothetical protein